jgi:hypothetical protein
MKILGQAEHQQQRMLGERDRTEAPRWSEIDVKPVETCSKYLPENDSRSRGRIDHLAGPATSLINNDANIKKLRLESLRVVEQDKLATAIERRYEITKPWLFVSSTSDVQDLHDRLPSLADRPFRYRRTLSEL